MRLAVGRADAAAAVALAVVAALALSGCGGGSSNGGATTTVQSSRVQVISPLGGRGFDPAAIYAHESPGVVTVISVFGRGAAALLGAGGATQGIGSGFVISGDGEVVTNAHVVAAGQSPDLRRAQSVYVQFPDRNEVPARIVGTDANDDVALLRISPAGLTLRPLPLGSSGELIVGSPVNAAMSPM